MFKFQFTEYSHKQFIKLDANTQRRIKGKLLFWQQQEDVLSFGKALKGFKNATHRFRVGDYRLICKVEHRNLVVLIVKLGHRRDIYK